MYKRGVLFVLAIAGGFMSHSQISFMNSAVELGLSFSCGTTYLGNGVSFCDFNNDGWDDITFTTADGEDLKFFKNNKGSFEPLDLNITTLDYQTKQVIWVDFDNDGDKDLFVTSNTNGNKLFENVGNLTFQDITLTAGFPLGNMFTYGASWGDYNNDGFLDVFISNRDPNMLTQTPNYLYKNNGDGTFTDVSIIAGIGSLNHLSFCSAFFDFNNDGWQDIYVSNDKYNNENLLYKNNGDGTFTEVGASSGTNVAIDAMTVTIGDYNNDGWFDIYVTNTPDGNVLFRNNGDETFTDVAQSSGTIFNSVGWGSIFLDADNDADLDLYVSGSIDNSTTLLSAAFYENLGDELFQVPGNAGFDNDIGNSYCNAVGDINNDGLPDFVVTNSDNQNIVLWENKNSNNNNWLKVTLEGTTSNRDGIGSVIEISVNGEKQYRYTLCGEGYLSQNSSSEFFGLGSSTTIDYVKVKWLSGTEDIFNNVSSNQLLHITEGSTLSVKDFDKSFVSVYPNPVSNNLHIKSEKPLNRVRVYNLLQQIVYDNDSFNSNEKLDFSQMKSGVYFLTVFIENQSKTIKIIKY